MSASIAVTDRIYLEIRWKSVKAGTGPSLTVWLDGAKAVKFDCFGRRGHWHIVKRRRSLWRSKRSHTKRDRIAFKERTVEAQIARVWFEVVNNLVYYLKFSDVDFALPKGTDLRVAATQAQQVMKTMLEENQ